jgi:hypothetical protein
MNSSSARSSVHTRSAIPRANEAAGIPTQGRRKRPRRMGSAISRREEMAAATRVFKVSGLMVSDCARGGILAYFRAIEQRNREREGFK